MTHASPVYLDVTMLSSWHTDFIHERHNQLTLNDALFAIGVQFQKSTVERLSTVVGRDSVGRTREFDHLAFSRTTTGFDRQMSDVRLL